MFNFCHCFVICHIISVHYTHTVLCYSVCLCHVVNDSLKDLLMKLLKRWKHSIKEDRMQQYLVRVCHFMCNIELFTWQL